MNTLIISIFMCILLLGINEINHNLIEINKNVIKIINSGNSNDNKDKYVRVDYANDSPIDLQIEGGYE